jgi:hypothetical protein
MKQKAAGELYIINSHTNCIAFQILLESSNHGGCGGMVHNMHGREEKYLKNLVGNT